MAETVDYDPFNSYPVDYDPWSGQSPFQNLKGYAGNLPQEPQHDMLSSGPHHIGWWDATKQALGGQVQGIAQSAYDLVTGPGRAFSGELSPEEMPGVAANAASLLTGGGIGRAALAGTAARTAAKDSLGVFAGQTAQGADLQALLEAKQLGKMNISPRYIMDKTGWFKGADGLWRYEIPDSRARLDTNALMSSKSVRDPVNPGLYENNPIGTMSDFLSHPDLYKAYPDLADMLVYLESNPQYAGSYMPHSDTMALAKHASDPMGTALHETQHAIQQREGFATGSTPEAAAHPVPELDEPAKALRNEMIAIQKQYPDTNGPFDLPAGPDRDRAIAVMTALGKYKQFKNTWGKAMYGHSAGEIEAENVRMRYVPGREIQIYPWQSQDLVAKVRRLPSPYTQIVTPPYTPPGMTRGPGGFGPLRPEGGTTLIKSSKDLEDLLGPKGEPYTPGGGGRFPSTQGSLDKAVTTNTRRDEKVPSVVTHPPEPEVMEAVRSIKGILSKPQVNAKYNIPYGWGSNKEGGITYRDLRIPGLIDISGKPTNVDKYLHTHEQIERILMILLRYPYEHAHLIATSFERAAVEADGLDWIAYETGINKQLEKTEGEKHANLPPDLFTEAYSAADLKKFTGQKSKSEVNYSKGMPKSHCGNCSYFIPSGKCQKVEGSISSSMWCKLWKGVPK